jgi:hypothetical protein
MTCAVAAQAARRWKVHGPPCNGAKCLAEPIFLQHHLVCTYCRREYDAILCFLVNGLLSSKVVYEHLRLSC